jgi:hypothetical protein
MAVIANVALTNTFDTWRTRSNQAFTRLNAFAIDELNLYGDTITANVRFVSAQSTRLGTTVSHRTIINGLTSANGILNVAGNTTVTGLLTASGRASVGTNLNVSGNTTIGAAGKVANVTGWFGVTGRATVSTNLFVAGNTTIGGALNINGAINLGDASTDLLTVTGRATVAQNLNVSGNTTLGGASKTLTVGGAGATANATGWFGVNGRATVSTNLNVGGNTKFGAVGKTANVVGFLSVSGHQYIFQNLQVAGNTTLGASGKTLTIGGTGAISNAEGWFGIAGRATVSTNLFVGGNTTLNGTTTDRSNALSQTLTDGATINWDVNNGRVATVTIGASRTIAKPTNLKVGTYILRVIQGGSGSYSLTWNNAFKWTAQTAPVLSTAVGSVDVITLFSDGNLLYGSYLPDMR